MNEQPSAPMLPPPSGPSAWISTWREALTKPNEQTYARMALSPNAKLSTALLWVFIGSLVNFFLASLVQGRLMAQMMQNSGLGLEGLPAETGGGLFTAICGAPIGALISVVFFALGAGVFQLIAKLFGGRGTYEQLAYVLAAIVTPFYFLSGALTLISAIPYVGACFGILGFVAALYVLYLEITAVKGVNQFGWGPAIATVLLPALVIACCVAVGIVSIFSMLGPEFAEMFEQMLTPVP
jgi:hypothetical protein